MENKYKGNSKKISTLCHILSGVSVLMMATTPSVMAEEASEGRKISGASLLMDEVMVYGTKRSAAESAQTVPGQVAAFGASQMEARQVITLQDLTMSTPNVQMDGIGTTPGVANFTIRGQGVNSSIPSIDPTVGVFVDGVYLGSTYGVIVDMFDIESVEIHKGPQGVLFGRNVTAGAVLLRTARPNGETSIKGKVGLETGLQYTAALAAQGSLVEDKLAAKVGIQYKEDTGYYENLTVGRNVGKNRTLIIRPTLVFTPNSSFDATLIWEHGEMEGDGAIAQVSAGFLPMSPNKDIETAIDNPGFVDVVWNQVTLEMNWDLGNGRLTNILAYRDVNSNAESDGDSTALDLFVFLPTTIQDQISNELRYNGMISDGWELTTGLYYYQSNLEYLESRSLLFDTTRIGGGGLQDHKTLGAFVNNYIDLSDTLVLQAGLRYSYEKKDVIIHPLGTCTFEQVCGAGNANDQSWSNWSPKVGLQWAASEDVTVYGHFARSFRAGGYNFRSPSPNPVSFDPERVDSLEIGLKSKLLDNRLRFNAAVFFNKLNNMQREVNLQDPVIGVIQDISNTASAEIFGIEIDAMVLVTDSLVLNASVGYLDDKYTEILVDLSGDGIIDQTDFDLSLPRLAKWTLNFGFTYDMELETGTLIARADYAYRSGAAYNDRNSTLFHDYSMINAGLTYEHG
ncbi:MAG: TonB-dependent receptor, partial [Emcibacter sp.]|nr:TonB-dependent receptor [Emcibacter sp.]